MYKNTLQHTAPYCNVYHTAIGGTTHHFCAAYCNTLQHTATHCNTLYTTLYFVFSVGSALAVLQYVYTYMNQYIATLCICIDVYTILYICIDIYTTLYIYMDIYTTLHKCTDTSLHGYLHHLFTFVQMLIHLNTIFTPLYSYV